MVIGKPCSFRRRLLVTAPISSGFMSERQYMMVRSSIRIYAYIAFTHTKCISAIFRINGLNRGLGKRR